MIKNGSKPGRNQVETSNFWDLFRYFWDLFLFLGPIKTLDLCHLHLDSPAGGSLYVITRTSALALCADYGSEISVLEAIYLVRVQSRFLGLNLH